MTIYTRCRFVIPALFLLTMLTSCKVGRFVIYNFADVNDYKKFPSRTVQNGPQAFVFPAAAKGKVPKTLQLKDKSYGFEQYLESNNTIAFLIIRNDTLQYEKYWKNYDKASVVPSFSIAKSVVSLLVGCALDDHLIRSIDDPVTDYIPELKENGFDKVTLKHLLQMTSDLKFNEGYANPFGDVATFYYGTNLRRAIGKMRLKAEPGTRFEYASGNTQLLGLVLERALNGRTITSYLEEKYGSRWKWNLMPAGVSTVKTTGWKKLFAASMHARVITPK